MEKKAIRLGFDMDRKGYLDKMEKYNSSNEASMKTDKKRFADYYGISLDKYINEKSKFIIPYEMADLFCFMMNAMKSSPTYDKRTTTLGRSLDDIISHNKMVIESLKELPPQLSDYIKMTPEYCNALYLVNYMPIIIERMASVVHLILSTNDTPISRTIEYLIDGLDDVYERVFWGKTRKETVFDWIEKNKDALNEFSINKDIMPTTEPYYLIDNRLADFFASLNRDNWPDGAESIVNVLLNKWEEKYKYEDDKNAKIKNEYLCWLCDQKWHELSKTTANPINFPLDDLIKEKLREYNDRYNVHTTIHRFSPKNNYISGMDDVEEIFQIRLSLQNTIDVRIVQELISHLKDLTEFRKVFQHSHIINLSKCIYLYIEKILRRETIEDTYGFLNSYLASIYQVLEGFDDKYKRYGLWDYADEVLEGMDFNDCCKNIYLDIFVKIQTRKCEQFNKNKKETELKDKINSAVGMLFKDIIKNDAP